MPESVAFGCQLIAFEGGIPLPYYKQRNDCAAAMCGGWSTCGLFLSLFPLMLPSVLRFSVCSVDCRLKDWKPDIYD